MVIHRFGGRGGKHTLSRDGWTQKTSCHYRKIPLLYAREDDQVIAKLERLADQSNIRARLSQHAAFKRMTHQKQGRRLRGMIDRSHQPISKVALRNKLKALGVLGPLNRKTGFCRNALEVQSWTKLPKRKYFPNNSEKIGYYVPNLVERALYVK